MKKIGYKGQGMMEYLITYGWAIMVVMIVGVVLWQLGVFGDTSTRLTCEECCDVCDAFSLNFSDVDRLGCECVSVDCVELGNKTYCKKDISIVRLYEED